jgi:hypothetical protein
VDPQDQFFITMELAIEENSKKMDKTDEQLVLVDYHKYLDIFSEEKAHRFPESRPWDHKIKMKEGFEPKSFKNYNLTPAEQIELDKFLKKNLEKNTSGHLNRQWTLPGIVLGLLRILWLGLFL